MDEVETLLLRILTPDARKRLASIEAAHPELTGSIRRQLLALARSSDWTRRSR